MGTHPIFESDFDCLTDCIMSNETSNESVNETIYYSIIEDGLDDTMVEKGVDKGVQTDECLEIMKLKEQISLLIAKNESLEQERQLGIVELKRTKDEKDKAVKERDHCHERYRALAKEYVDTKNELKESENEIKQLKENLTKYVNLYQDHHFAATRPERRATRSTAVLPVPSSSSTTACPPEVGKLPRSIKLPLAPECDKQ